MPRAPLSEPEISAFREQICAAATKLFAENGYDAVTLRAIAAEVGCSPMTPYSYFRDRDEIFAAVKAAAFERFADAQEAAVEGIDDPTDRMAAGGMAYIEFALAEPAAYRIMFELHQNGPSDYPELMRQGERAWATLRDAVGRAIDAGVLAGDPDTVAHVFWAGVHGIVSLHLAGKLELGRSLETLTGPMLVSLMLGNLGPRARKNELEAIASAGEEPS